MKQMCLAASAVMLVLFLVWTPVLAGNATEEMKITKVNFELVGREQPLIEVYIWLNDTIKTEELQDYSVMIVGENGSRSDRMGYTEFEIKNMQRLRFINSTTGDIYDVQMAVEEGLLNPADGTMKGIEPYVMYQPTFTGAYRFDFWLWDSVGKIKAVALYHNGSEIDRRETPFEYTPIYGEYVVFTPSRKVSYTFS
ncbi:MAG TPA: hypothetical protein PLR75_05900 [Candidatus Pacearchaeota archaeon]|nr:hypothetical protein [Candidatus Pacearchaeota archaeon]